jgi:phosphoglycerate dehydrogenase-like enzyme
MIHSLQNGNIGVPTGKTISGSMFLIYGYGGIGSQLNSKLLSLGASTRIISRTANVNEFNHIHATKENSSSLERCQMGSPERLSEYLAMSDVVALCTTQNQHTVGLVNKSFLSQMKKGSYLVNVTRVPPPPLLLPRSPSSYPPRMFSQGGLISYPDLYQALLDSHLGGVGLDVYHTEPFPLLSDPQTQVTDPLLTHPNVIVTPHIAGVTEQSYRGMAKILGDNIKALINGEEVKHCVN